MLALESQIEEIILRASNTVAGDDAELVQELAALERQPGITLADRGVLRLARAVQTQSTLNLDEFQFQLDEAIALLEAGDGRSDSLSSAMAISASVAATRGDITRCLDVCGDLILRSKTDPDSFTSATRQNFGLALGQLGAFDQALENLKYSFVEGVRSGNENKMVTACMNIADCLSQIAMGKSASEPRLDDAHKPLVERMERALADVEPHCDVHTKNLSRTVRAQLAYMGGNRALASEIWGDLDASLMHPHPGFTKYFSAVAADVFSYRGEFDTALKFVRISMEPSAMSTKWHVLQGHLALSRLLMEMGDATGAAEAAQVATELAFDSALSLPRLLIGQLSRQAELERSRAELAHKALVDPLSGLGNRRGLRVLVDQLAAEPARQAIVVCIDLDRFKQINDEFGHEAGDEVIVQVAHILQEVSDGHVFRHGGDEFGIVIDEGAELATGIEVGERVRQALAAASWDFSPHQQHVVTCSVGVASGSSHVVGELIREADSEMYVAKKRGRNGVAARLHPFSTTASLSNR